MSDTINGLFTSLTLSLGDSLADLLSGCLPLRDSLGGVLGGLTFTG